MEKSRLLLVEDDPAVRRLFEMALCSAGFNLRSVADAEAAFELLHNDHFELLITDLLLPQGDGISLMREARMIDPDLQVILVTGAATIESAVAAVNHGAHSYLRKPLRIDELLMRVNAALCLRRERLERRATLQKLGVYLLRLAEPTAQAYTLTDESTAQLRVGQLQLDPRRRRVMVGSHQIPVSSGEFDLLHYLARRPSQVVSPDELAREVFGLQNCSSGESSELMKSRVYRLRRKLEILPEALDLLVSVRGAGYMLTDEP